MSSTTRVIIDTEVKMGNITYNVTIYLILEIQVVASVLP